MRKIRILLVPCVVFGFAALGWHFLILEPPSNQDMVKPPVVEPESQFPPWFVDCTADVGLDFIHDAGSTGDYFMPQCVGSGAALLDFDNDGKLDIYLIQNGGPSSTSVNRLFRQGTDGRFIDLTEGCGLDVTGFGMGTAVGDVNNDGWVDVLVTEFGRMRLFRNNKDSTFSDISQTAGLENPKWSTSACFFDYDRDGWLDLVVANYNEYEADVRCAGVDGKPDFCGPKVALGSVTALYHNLGTKASVDSAELRFEDASVSSGMWRLKGPGLGVVCEDFTGDGWPDILVANDGAANHLWINQRNGTFDEEAVVRGIAYDSMGQALANMGIAIGDVDGDGLLDVFITHLQQELHSCYRQDPAGHFQDQTAEMGLAKPAWRSTGFGTLFGDFDQDGDVDLVLANGGVKRKGGVSAANTPAKFWSVYDERNQVFVNDGAGSFNDLSKQNPALCALPGVFRGVATGDIDGDGDLDLVVTQIHGPARIYRNVAPKSGHWLMLRAIDPALGGRDAYGTKITVRAGTDQWKRTVNPAFSFLCSNAPHAHFGLGAMAQIDAIEVQWPDGTTETFPGTSADRVLVLQKGSQQAE